MKKTLLEKLKRKMKNWKKEEPDYTDAYWRREFYYVDSSKEEVEWKIVETKSGDFIRRPFPVKKNTLLSLIRLNLAKTSARILD